MILSIQHLYILVGVGAGKHRERVLRVPESLGHFQAADGLTRHAAGPQPIARLCRATQELQPKRLATALRFLAQ